MMRKLSYLLFLTFSLCLLHNVQSSSSSSSSSLSSLSSLLSSSSSSSAASTTMGTLLRRFKGINTNDDDDVVSARISSPQGHGFYEVIDQRNAYNSPEADPTLSPLVEHPAASDDAINNQYAAIIEYKNIGTRPRSGWAHVNGHMAVLKNPINHFSLFPPLDGCNKTDNPNGKTRYKTSETARAHKCLIATNGGLWQDGNTPSKKTGNCLGNIVSEGKIIQVTGHHDAQFGLRKDGTLVTGFIPPADILKAESPGKEFVSLVTGFVWLVRDGRNYVQRSVQVEDFSQQATGGDFATIVSARTAIGHDADGNIVFTQIDGKSWERGINLSDLADLMIEHGVVNAINLDGGGSATWATNGTVVNYVSDKCEDNSDEIFYCERPITTITCMHNYEQKS